MISGGDRVSDQRRECDTSLSLHAACQEFQLLNSGVLVIR